uniref:Reticulon-like protein n=1 Tax=Kalanchoe fedtschenkoi TaxID=63787 RepID=A0A7N1A9R4_KALFE
MIITRVSPQSSSSSKKRRLPHYPHHRQRSTAQSRTTDNFKLVNRSGTSSEVMSSETHSAPFPAPSSSAQGFQFLPAIIMLCLFQLDRLVTWNNIFSFFLFPDSFSSGFFKDIFLWRRRSLSLLTLLLSTVAWVLLEAYEFNFVTVACWACMLAIVAVFLWDNLLRLLGKEPGKLASWEMTEESSEAVASSVRELIEEGIRWMFRVTVEKQWYVFAGTATLLFVISEVVSFFDLLSLLYAGTLIGMTVPVTYWKYEDKIKRYGEGLKVRWGRMCQVVDDRVVRKVKSKFVVNHVKKDKKVE